MIELDEAAEGGPDRAQLARRLLGIDAKQSARLRRAILSGDELAKPGFVRLNLSGLMTDEKVDFILESLCSLAEVAPELARDYDCNPLRAIFTARTRADRSGEAAAVI